MVLFNTQNYKINVELTWQILPQDDTVEVSGFFPLRTVKVTRHNYKMVNVEGEIVVKVPKESEWDTAFKTQMNDVSQSYASRDIRGILKYDIEDGDMIYHNCLVTMMTCEDNEYNTYNLRPDFWVNNGYKFNDMSLCGVYEFPADFKEDYVEYIKKNPRGWFKKIR